MSSKSFFMVWNPQAGAPRYQHDNVNSARAEAERLAQQNPNQTFFVLQALSKSTAMKVNTEVLAEELPF